MLKTDEYGSSYIDFVKMHGAGNDYIYIDAVSDPASMPDDPNTLSVKISDRHFGVGSDGLVVIMPSEVADFRMRMFNADGSEAQMCGNATRCIGKFVYDRGLTRKREVTLETLSGIKVLSLHVGDDDRVRSVTVDMGLPHVEGEVEMVSEGKTFRAVSVNVGNPHGVVFIDEAPDDALVLGHGPRLECAPCWPEKANIEFLHVIAPHEADARVWERGIGETLACGTGACATAVAALLTERAASPVNIKLPGGSLQIEWQPGGSVYMSGPARTVYQGEITLAWASEAAN